MKTLAPWQIATWRTLTGSERSRAILRFVIDNEIPLQGGKDDDTEEDDEAKPADEATSDGDKKSESLAKAESKKKSAGDSADELARIRAENSELRAEKAARAARAKAKKDKEAIDKGDAKRVIDEKDAVLKEREARIAALEARLSSEAERKFSQLPKEVQEAIRPFKDDLPPERWTALVESSLRPGDASAAPAGDGDDKKKTPPPTGAPMKSKNKGEYQPLEETARIFDEEIMPEYGNPVGSLKKLDVVRKANGANIFRYGVKQMIGIIRGRNEHVDEYRLDIAKK